MKQAIINYWNLALKFFGYPTLIVLILLALFAIRNEFNEWLAHIEQVEQVARINKLEEQARLAQSATNDLLKANAQTHAGSLALLENLTIMSKNVKQLSDNDDAFALQIKNLNLKHNYEKSRNQVANKNVVNLRRDNRSLAEYEDSLLRTDSELYKRRAANAGDPGNN